MLSRILIAVAVVLPLLGAAPATTGVPGPVLSGRITDADGKPVANATVSLNGPSGGRTTTDADGKYFFATIRAAGQHRIGITAEGFITIDPYNNHYGEDPVIQLTPRSQATKDFTLQRGVKIRVRVVDVTGVPVRGASVDISVSRNQSRGYRREQTNDAGRVTISVPASPAPYVVSAITDGHEPVHGKVDGSDVTKTQEIELILLPATPVKGVAICKDGKPAAGWRMVAYPEWWATNYIPAPSMIDKDGNFTLNEVGPGKYRLQIWMENQLHEVAQLSIPLEKQPLRVDVPFESPSTRVKFMVKVRVTGPRPDYIGAAAVATNRQQNWFHENVEWTRPAARRSTTGPAAKPNPNVHEGTVTWPALPADTYELRFESPFIEAKVIEAVKVPGEIPTVELISTGKPRITGKVVDSAGKPLAQFAVRAKKIEMIGKGTNYTQDFNWTQVSDPDGKFDIDLVSPGVYLVQASADGYAWTWSEKVRVESGNSKPTLQIKLTPGGSISGRAVDSSGKPVEGARVIPFSMAATNRDRRRDQSAVDAGAVTTDAEGRFLLTHLAPGDEKLRVTHASFAPRMIDKIAVSEGSVANAGDVKLPTGAVAEGTVYDGNGKPAGGVTLEFQDSLGYRGPDDEVAGRLATPVTDIAGKYRVEHLPEQIIYVGVADAWQRYGTVRRTIRPLDGKTVKLDFGGTTPVNGRLMTSSTQPAANTKVQLSIESQHWGPVMVQALTNAEGRFNFMGPPPGSYVLCSERKSERSSTIVKIKPVEITGQPQELGDISADTGEIVVLLSADDPADVATIRHVSVSEEVAGSAFPNHVTSLTNDKSAQGTWRGQDLPVGKLRIDAQRGDAGSSIGALFERKAGEKETTVKLRIPAARATLKVAFTNTVTDPDGRIFAIIRSEDGAVRAYASQQANGNQLRLPAGKYFVIDQVTGEPRKDVEPIVLKDGDTKDIGLAAQPKPGGEGARTVQVCFWSDDGLLYAAGKPQIVDAAGKPVETTSSGGLGHAFRAAPGKYRVTLDRHGKGPHTQEIEVPAVAPGKEWEPIHVTLPG